MHEALRLSPQRISARFALRIAWLAAIGASVSMAGAMGMSDEVRAHLFEPFFKLDVRVSAER